MREVEIEPTFESWQVTARGLLRAGVPPDTIVWREVLRGEGVPAQTPAASAAELAPVARESESAGVRVPPRFIDLARHVAGHPDPARWELLYQVLWRLVHERRDLLTREADLEVSRLLLMERELTSPLERQVREAPRARARAAARGPVTPGRLEQAALVEGPATSAAPFVPAGAGLAELQAAAARCAGCDLYRHATQTVFGRGPTDARIVLVGEQPGDQEDRQGAPFVGPAGEVLDRALAEVGLPRDRLYVTNAVKHFKFVPRGKRRIHQTPRSAEILACQPWLEAELALIRPEVLVCLGATAARALLGADFRLMKERGRFMTTRWAPKTIATFHPSAVLRGEDDTMQTQLYRMLADDLRLVAGVT